MSRSLPVVVPPKIHPFRHPVFLFTLHHYATVNGSTKLKYLSSETCCLKSNPANPYAVSMVINGVIFIFWAYDKPPASIQGCVANPDVLAQQAFQQLGVHAFAPPHHAVLIRHHTRGEEGSLFIMQPSLIDGEAGTQDLLAPFFKAKYAQHRILLDETSDGLLLFERFAPQNALTERAYWMD